jgi:hypothetical protein
MCLEHNTIRILKLRRAISKLRLSSKNIPGSLVAPPTLSSNICGKLKAEFIVNYSSKTSPPYNEFHIILWNARIYGLGPV